MREVLRSTYISLRYYQYSEVHIEHILKGRGQKEQTYQI